MFCWCKQLRNILEITMLSKVNKVNKDNTIFVFFSFIFFPTPHIIYSFYFNYIISMSVPFKGHPFCQNLMYNSGVIGVES